MKLIKRNLELIYVVVLPIGSVLGAVVTTLCGG